MQSALDSKPLQKIEQPPSGGAVRLLFFVAIVLLGYACYANTLGCFFYCDDFIFLEFFHDVLAGNTSALWTIFCTPLTELQPFLHCYRPLPFLFIFLEYCFYGTNPIGYHASNIMAHCLCSILVFCITESYLRLSESTTKLGNSITKNTWIAFAAAALYASYPMNGEVPNLPTNMVTCLGALFALLTVCTFLWWQEGRNKAVYALSVGSCMLGLLCKENSLTLPAVLAAYLFMTQTQGDWLARAKQALRSTAWFWAVLGVYMVIRFMVLGPVVGGYHGPCGIWLQESWHYRFSNGWFLTCLFPLNPEVVNNAKLSCIGLAALYALFGVLALRRLSSWKQSPQLRRNIVFLVGWFALVFLTVSPVWNLEYSLAGSRHFYLASAPLAMALAIITYSEQRRRYWAFLMMSLVSCFIFINIKNNEAWILASDASRTFRDSACYEVKRLTPHQSLVLVNPLYWCKGVILFSDSDMVRTMFQVPAVEYDISRRVETLSPWIIVNHDLINVSRLRKLAASTTHKLAFWDSDTDTLRTFNGNFGSTKIGSFRDGSLDKTISPANKHFDQTNNVSIEEFVCDPDELRKDCDLIECTLTCQRLEGVPVDTKAAMSIEWQTVSNKESSPQRTWYLPVIDDGLPHTYRFPVATRMNWLTSQHNGHFKICMPSPNFKNDLKSVRLLGWRYMAPSLNVSAAPTADATSTPSWKITSEGVLVLPSKQCIASFDASKISQAKGVLVEISPVDCLLEVGVVQGARDYVSKHAARRVRLTNLVGQVQLTPRDFPARGLYEVEVGALSETGKLLGHCSDPTFIAIP